MMRITGGWRRLVVLAALAATAVAAGLAAGTGTGQAATLFDPDLLQSLIGTDGNGVQQVSYGEKTAFLLHVKNTGDSTTPQLVATVVSDNGTPSQTDDDGTFVDMYYDSTKATCDGSGSTVTCTPIGGSLKAGEGFDVQMRFTVPMSGEFLKTTATLTVAAKTVGGSNNQGTTLATDPETTQLITNTTKKDTFLRKTESTATTGKFTADDPQNFGVTLPDGLLGDPFGIEVSIHDEQGGLCDGCPNGKTKLTIPAAASLVTAFGNPFYTPPSPIDPEQFPEQRNPYSWEMHAKTPPGFKATQVLYLPDGATAVQSLPKCSDIGGGPTATYPVCYDTLTTDTGKKLADATGHGLENGELGFGI